MSVISMEQYGMEKMMYNIPVLKEQKVNALHYKMNQFDIAKTF